MAPVIAEQTKRAQAYHAVRFPFDPRRAIVWQAVCGYLQRFVDASGGLLELGAGYGEFSRYIEARRKWAMDLNPELTEKWPAEVEPVIQSVMEEWPIEDDSLKTVFASNFFEHFTIAEGEKVLARAARALAPGGRLIVVQPNFRLQPRRYFDDYTHKAIYTDTGFADFVQAQGWKLVHAEGRFLPFSMKSRLPTWGWLVRMYLALPWRPMAGQFLVVAERPEEA